VCPVPRFAHRQTVHYHGAASGAHEFCNAGIIEANYVTRQAGLGSFPFENAKLRTCKGFLGRHAADALSAGVIWEVTADLAPLRAGELRLKKSLRMTMPVFMRA
jgi:hypothetical protein